MIGGGYTGVELAGQLADLFAGDFRALYPEILADEPRITLIQAGDRILPILKESSSQKALRRLERLGVKVVLNARAASVSPEGVTIENGEVLRADHVIWTSGVIANGEAFFAPEFLQKGRVMVKSTLQMPDHPEVFVIGDLAGVTEGNGPHPQTAQAAFEQAHFVAQNLKKLVSGGLAAFYYYHKGTRSDWRPLGDC